MEGRKKLMTVAERLKWEGREEGIQEGVQNVARNMLQMNKDEEEIIELTGVTKAELEKLKESL